MSDEKERLEKLAEEKRQIMRRRGEMLRQYGDDRSIPDRHRREIQRAEDAVDRKATEAIKRTQRND